MSQTIQRTLYGYWRSSASYRVRIVLHLKKLDYTYETLQLVKNEQRSDDFLAKNPQGLVPLFVERDGDSVFKLPQSLAIMDYLEKAYPEKPILPADARVCAAIHAASQIIACEVHPLDNLRVLQYLENDLAIAEDAKMTWYRHWIQLGFSALEKQLATILGDNTFSLGDKPGYLEAVIVPQVYNANRFNCPLEAYPRLAALNEACLELPEFIAASPEKQPDAS